jgi:hypothetical protein
MTQGVLDRRRAGHQAEALAGYTAFAMHAAPRITDFGGAERGKSAPITGKIREKCA